MQGLVYLGSPDGAVTRNVVRIRNEVILGVFNAAGAYGAWCVVWDRRRPRAEDLSNKLKPSGFKLGSEAVRPILHDKSDSCDGGWRMLDKQA